MTLNTANFNYPPLEVFRRTTNGSGIDFSMPAAAQTLIITPKHETGNMTTLTVDLEVKEDDGVYRVFATALALAAVAQKVAVEGLGGRTVRLTSTVFTLGTVTTAVLNVTCGKISH